MHKALVKQLTYPIHEKLVNRPTFSYLKELDASQWLSRDALEALQLKKLKDLLRVGKQHCPWHAQRIAGAGLDLAKGADPLTLDFSGYIP